MNHEKKGKLKIFLGYAAGVGKTYAMLEAAGVRRLEGVDVIVGLALTHGRKETEKLLAGLEILPTIGVKYKGVELQELDLDGILLRRPQLVIVDELAHTNVPGSRHLKRYMDIEEILEAGIDVYTTLNIQHLESFQDPIEQATGIPVKERVPDRIVDAADELELVDLAPEELLERLRQGKVYVPDLAARAIHKFFKIDNLQLLREISLRKTAAIVDIERVKTGKELTYGVAPKLLASIGSSPFSERVVRAAKRLADMLKAEWVVISVETPEMAFRSPEEKGQLNKHLRLAEELGAKCMTLPGESVADTIFNYAKTNGVTQIILGHSLMPWWKRFWYKSPVDELVRKDDAIDIYIISSGKAETIKKAASQTKGFLPPLSKIFFHVGLPFSLVLLLTIFLSPFADLFSPTSFAISYFLSVALAALFLSPISFYFYAFFAIFMLDTVYVTDFDQWLLHREPLLFSVATLAIGVVINKLMTHHRRLVATAVARHQEILRLFDLSRDLAAAPNPSTMLSRFNQHLETLLPAEGILYLSQEGDYKRFGQVEVPFDMTEQMAAIWAIDHQELAGFETDTLPSAKGLWIPLTVARRHAGALGIYAQGKSLADQRELLEAFAHLMALSLDRGERSEEEPTLMPTEHESHQKKGEDE